MQCPQSLFSFIHLIIKLAITFTNTYSLSRKRKHTIYNSHSVYFSFKLDSNLTQSLLSYVNEEVQCTIVRPQSYVGNLTGYLPSPVQIPHLPKPLWYFIFSFVHLKALVKFPSFYVKRLIQHHQSFFVCVYMWFPGNGSILLPSNLKFRSGSKRLQLFLFQRYISSIPWPTFCTITQGSIKPKAYKMIENSFCLIDFTHEKASYSCDGAFMAIVGYMPGAKGFSALQSLTACIFFIFFFGVYLPICCNTIPFLHIT